MSGTLGQAVIEPKTSCKIYSNSSGNPASVTIHAQVLDTETNAEMSMQYSSSDVCVVCTNSQSLSCTPLNEFDGMVNTSTCFYGYYYNEPTWEVVRGYCDTNTPTTIDGVIWYPDTCCKFCNTVPGVGLSCWGTCIPTTMSQMDGQCVLGNCVAWCSDMGKLSFLKANCRSIFVSGNGEDTNNYAIHCCQYGSGGSYATYDFWSYMMHFTFGGATCGCYPTLQTQVGVNCRMIHGKGNIDQLNEGVDCDHTFCHNPLANTGAWMATQDIWHTGSPYHYFYWNGMSACSAMGVQYFNCLQGCFCGQSCCGCIPQTLFGNDFGCKIRGCCSWSTAACNCFHKLHKMWQKPVIAGCGMVLWKQTNGSGTYVIPYGADTNYSPCCALGCLLPVAYSAGTFQAEACCKMKFYIEDDSGEIDGASPIKWIWYNPYDRKNYMEILGSPNYSGIYTLATASTWGTGLAAGNAACCICCAYPCDLISEGYITKVGDTPTVWNGRGAWDLPTQPRLVGSCCWAIWYPCFCCNTDNDLYWNGCWTRFTSGDLINWTQSTSDGIIAARTDTGSYPTQLVSTAYSTTGSNGINQESNYYFCGTCLNGSGTLEFRSSANRLERTGIVLSNLDNLYFNNGSSAKVSVQVWGYDE